jgi:hypothetical protein
VGRALDRTTRKLVTHLAADPEFDPLLWEEDINNFAASRLKGKRPGLVTLVQRQLNQHAYENGLIEKVEEEIKREARAALNAMTRLDRDIYGFTSRNAKRLQLAEPYISHVKESRRRFVINWMSRFEGEELRSKREARYATAIRALVAGGNQSGHVANPWHFHISRGPYRAGEPPRCCAGARRSDPHGSRTDTSLIADGTGRVSSVAWSGPRRRSA